MKSPLLLTLTALITLMILQIGCSPVGTAEMVRRDQRGGILALKGDRDRAWEQAKYEMYQHCEGDNWKVIAEENKVVGERTEYVEDERQRSGSRSSVTRRSRRSPTRRSTQRSASRRSGVAVTEPIREYQITYQCRARPDEIQQPAP